MTVRKLITFPDRGAQLLQQAIGEAKERAAGEYLTAIMQQRRQAWTRALDQLLEHGATRQALRDGLVKMAGLGRTPRELLERNPVTLAHEDDAYAFHALLLEYEANNRALLDALGQP